MGKLIAWTKKVINQLYFSDNPISENDLAVSRRISIFEGCTARTIVTITGGAFLAGYAKYLGASDQITGIISSVPTLSGIVMFFSPLIIERLENRKFIITFSAFFSRVLLSIMFFIPQLIANSALKLLILVLLFLAANISVSFITPAASNWLISITPEDLRGSYFGKRESIILGFVAVVSLLIGEIIDRFKIHGSLGQGFIIIFLISIIFTTLNFCLASAIKEPKVNVELRQVRGKDLYSLPLKNRKFRKIIFLMILWNIGLQLSGPFIPVYMVSGLHLSYAYITISVILASAASVASAGILGRIADKKSWIFFFEICVLFQTLSLITWFFTNRNTYYLLVPLAQLLGGAALGGVNISLSNIQYKYSPIERKTVYLGFSTAAAGLFGFMSSFCGSMLVGAFKDFKITFSKFYAGNMQLLFGISSILLILCFFCILFEKTKISSSI